MTPSTVRVMAEYECFPAWLVGSASTENVDPADLPISASLVGDLMRWARDYDDTLNRQDPAASGFASDADEAEFDARSEGLARRLADELGSGYVVEYFDGRTGLRHLISSQHGA